jgi:hypothetical protein
MNPTAQADIARTSSAGVWLFRGRRWLDPTDPHDVFTLAANHARLCALFPAVAAPSGLAAFTAAVGNVSRRWAILSSSLEPAARTRWCTSASELEDRTLVKTAGAPFPASDLQFSLCPAHAAGLGPRAAGLDVTAIHCATRSLSTFYCEPCAGSVPPIFDASASGCSPHYAGMDTVTVPPRTAVGCYDGSGSAVSMGNCCWDHRNRPGVTSASELEDRTLAKTARAPFSASDFKLSLSPAHAAGLDVLADRFLSLSHRCEPCAGSVPPIFDAWAGGRSPDDAGFKIDQSPARAAPRKRPRQGGSLGRRDSRDLVTPRTAAGCYDGSGSVSMSGWDHRDRPGVTDARLADAGSSDSEARPSDAGEPSEPAVHSDEAGPPRAGTCQDHSIKQSDNTLLICYECFDEAGLNAGQAVDRVLADLEPAGVALAALAPPDVWP